MNICYSFREANNKFADQTVRMRRLPVDGGGDVRGGGGGGGGNLIFFLDK